jgi:hypothetical protein
MKINKIYEVLFSNIKSAMLGQTIQSIEKQGGVGNFIKTQYKTANKQIRNELANYILAGYITGRTNYLLANNEPDITYEYIATLDLDLCENCGIHDGLQLTKDEWIESGIKFKLGSDGINPDCLGTLRTSNKNPCRCILAPVGRR